MGANNSVPNMPENPNEEARYRDEIMRDQQMLDELSRQYKEVLAKMDRLKEAGEVVPPELPEQLETIRTQSMRVHVQMFRRK